MWIEIVMFMISGCILVSVGGLFCLYIIHCIWGDPSKNFIEWLFPKGSK